MKHHFIALLLLISTTLNANFNFGECQGSGTFEQQIVHYGDDYENTATVGSIPQGIIGLRVELISSKDVDIRLYGENNDKIVHWPHGIHHQSTQKTKPYKDSNVTYSGYNGTNGQKGHEFIEVAGSTPTVMMMKAFGYKAGYATVNYSWIGKEGCTSSESGEGNFTQTLEKDTTSLVGTIPPNVNNVQINLTSDKDLDIQLFGADGTAIASWKPTGLMAGANTQSILYNDMNITWSGYNGTAGKRGHEFITVTPKTTEVLVMKVFGYESGEANVTYSWGDVENTLYVTADDREGDYKCNGYSDQVEINNALDTIAANPKLTTLYLKGPMTCVIDQPILISSNTALLGDANVTIRLKDNAEWNTQHKPLIGQKNDDGSIAWQTGDHGSGTVSNVVISGFELSGGKQLEPTGQYYVILVSLYGASDIKIHNMNLHDSRGDIMRFWGTDPEVDKNIEIYNNIIKDSGHEGMYFISTGLISAYNNKIYSTRTNAGIRVSGKTKDFVIYDNTIGNSLTNIPSGYAGILISPSWDSPLENGEIYGNYIFGKTVGIALNANAGYDTKDTLKDVHIHHNRLYKIRNYSDASHLNGAIRIKGFHNTLVEFNTIDSSEKDGIVFDEFDGVNGRETNYHTIVRNNIISNSGGYGINNLNTNIHTFDLAYNNLYRNTTGNYNNAVSTTDIDQNPLYANTKFKAGWHHIVGSYDSVTEMFRLYIDGKENAEKHVVGFGSIASNNYFLYVGSYLWLNIYGLDAKVDDVAIWERSLDDTEISGIWNHGEGSSIDEGTVTTDMIAYWKMENNFNDSYGVFDGTSHNASFSADAKLGGYTALVDGNEDNYVYFPRTISPVSSVTVSAWVYLDQPTLDDSAHIHTILNKGDQSRNDHIWLYVKGDKFYFELGNGLIRNSISSAGINPNSIDLHLKSETGRWNGTTWVQDADTSPAIDQGDPESTYINEPSPNGQKVNIGAYGNTDEASKTVQ